MNYPNLRPNIVIKNIERPAIYDIENDNLYELDSESYELIKYFSGKNKLEDIIAQSEFDKDESYEFVNSLEELGLIEDRFDDSLDIFQDPKPIKPPSLRILLIHLTTGCNMRCKHCYLRKDDVKNVPLDILLETIREFVDLQGFKILLSGGEPLLYPDLFKLLNKIKNLKIRKVLFSNGLLMNEDIAFKLKGLVQEVQISVDGLKSTHDEFRNCKGAYDSAINAIKILKKHDFPVSISTMVHGKNLQEFDELSSLFKGLEVDNWYLDMPCGDPDSDFIKEYGVSPEDAGSILRENGWGNPPGDFSINYACGAHLCAIMANGDVSKCGFFENEPVGNISNESLETLWGKIQEDYIWDLKKLECYELKCPYIEECYGGCRYRAKIMFGGLMKVDKVKCKMYNFL